MRHQKLLINSQLKDRVIEGPERDARASACLLEGAKLDPAVQTGQQQRADVKLKYELTGHDQFCQLRWCNQLKLNPALGCIAGECGFNEERM